MGKGKRARAASNAARHPNTTAKQMIRERNQIADSIVKGLRIAQQDVSKVMTNVTHLLAVGMTKSEVVRAMNTDPLVITSRGGKLLTAKNWLVWPLFAAKTKKEQPAQTRTTC
ncbi:hypothetical protein LNP44_00070 [Klebsiella pneumoniae subsp. pneumoniae]|jgi:hypothetical protein|nr:hypothetical protein [Klebsiella pneumoniae subsp. pneumoniae]